MGRSYTPTYRVECTAYTHDFTPMQWHGRVSDKRLADYVLDLNRSFLTGGINEVKSGPVPYVYRARIVRQSTDAVVATYTAPMFTVID